MRKFKSVEQAQRFLGAHAAVYNLFNLGRHLVSAKNYRYFRLRAFASWEKGSGSVEVVSQQHLTSCAVSLSISKMRIKLRCRMWAIFFGQTFAAHPPHLK